MGAGRVLTLSNSSLSCFGQCPKRYEWRYIQRLVRPLSRPPLAFGQLLHAAREAYWIAIQARASTPERERAPLRDVLQLVCDVAIRDWANARREEYLRHIKAHGIDAEVETALSDEGPDSIAGMEALVREMMRYYAEKWGDQDEQVWEVLAVEQELTAPLLRSATGATVLYAGKIDLLLRSRDTGAVFVVDHKSTVSSNPDRYNADLDQSPQMMGYVWLIERALGIRVQGAIYDVQRKRVPESPSVLKQARQGRKLSIAADTTPELYRHAIDQHDPGNEAAYEDIMRKLDARGDTFAWRYQYSLPDDVAALWEESQREAARALRRCGWKGNRYHRVLGNCIPWAGSPCDYRVLCLTPGGQDDPWLRNAYDVAKGEPGTPIELQLESPESPATPRDDDCPF